MTEEKEKTYLAVVPKHVFPAHDPGVLVADSANGLTATTLSSLPFLRLPHPRTAKASLYLPSSSSASPSSSLGSPTSDPDAQSQNGAPKTSDGHGTILEVQAINPTPPRTWFLTNPNSTGLEPTPDSKPTVEERIIGDGSLLIFTPIDPIFLVVPLLVGLLKPPRGTARSGRQPQPSSSTSTSTFVSALTDPTCRGNYLPLGDMIEEMSRLPSYTTGMEQAFKPKPKLGPGAARSQGRGGSSRTSRGNGSALSAENSTDLSSHAMQPGPRGSKRKAETTAEEVDDEEAQRLEMEGMGSGAGSGSSKRFGRNGSGSQDVDMGNGSSTVADVDVDKDDPTDPNETEVQDGRRSRVADGEDDDGEGNVDVIRLCAIEEVRNSLLACSESQNLPSMSTTTDDDGPTSATQTFYRPSPNQILSHLQKKVSRLATREVIDGSEGLMRGLAMSGIGLEVMDAGVSTVSTGTDAKPANETGEGGEESKADTLTPEEIRTARLRLVADQARRKVACELIGQYLPVDVLTALMGSYDFSALTEHLEAQANLSFASSHNATISNPADANTLIGDSGIKKKPAVVVSQGSRGVKALEKVNTSKMPKLTSFFTKKVPPAAKK